jgi:hypothetical protein
MAKPERPMIDDATIERLWIDRIAGELSADVEALLSGYLAERPALRESLDVTTAVVSQARQLVAARGEAEGMPALRMGNGVGSGAVGGPIGSRSALRGSGRSGRGRWRAVAMAASVVLAFVLGRAGVPSGSGHDARSVVDARASIDDDRESRGGFWSGARLRAHVNERARGVDRSRVRWASPLRPVLGAT